MITLSKGDLFVVLTQPGEFYCGTRFDNAGVFRRIDKGGYIYADKWFERIDPYRHDCVCGPSEEFVTVDFRGVKPGGLFCKVGVGLLVRPDEKPYDWFHLYEVANPGVWKISKGNDSVTFEHVLSGWYYYKKTVSLIDENHFSIAHTLRWDNEKPLEGFVYNHNFFTFNGVPVGPSRKVSFPWKPAGDWRKHYSNAHFSPDGIEFTDVVDPANAVYSGNIHNEEGCTTYDFEVSEGRRRVRAAGSQDLEKIIFWANDKVACVEPYQTVKLEKGCLKNWDITYELK